MDAEQMGQHDLDRLLRGLVKATNAVQALPAVATLDWCDSAAKAAASLVTPALAVVTIGTLDDTGRLDAHEASGVGVGAEPTRGDRARPASEQRLGFRGEDGRIAALRVRAPRLSQLGFRFENTAPDAVFTGRLDDLLDAAAGKSDLPTMWENLDAGGVMLGVARLEPIASGRVILVQIAHAEPSATIDPADTRSLAAFMPVLAARADLALGSEPAEETRWLTQREQMVLEHLTLGKSVRQIAEDLGRSPHTVHDHVKGLHRKLGATSRGELIARALGYIVTEPKPQATESREVKPNAETGLGATAAIEPKPARENVQAESRPSDD